MFTLRIFYQKNTTNYLCKSYKPIYKSITDRFPLKYIKLKIGIYRKLNN